MLDDFSTGLAIGGIIGILGTIALCFLIIIPDFEAAYREQDKKILNSVGIEKIEACHNVYSNWNEIVWLEGKANERKQ